jgi:hypothetical protein
MISIRFAEDQQEALYKQLEKFLSNSNIGISKERYLELIELMGEEYDEDRAPPDMSDFPEEVHDAFTMYNSIPGEYAGMGGTYVGKNWGVLPVLFDLYKVPKASRVHVFSILSWLDSRNVEKSVKAANKSAKK